MNVGGFDTSQSFEGEITDVHMWDYILSGRLIKAVYSNQEPYEKGNVINWNTIKYEITGNVLAVKKNLWSGVMSHTYTVYKAFKANQ